MESLDLDHYDAEVIPRDDASNVVSADRVRQRPVRQRLSSAPTQPTEDAKDQAAVALEMVSEAAAAIRMLEDQSAQAVTRAHDLASAIVQKLELTEIRAADSEAALEQTRTEVAELTAALAQTRADLEMTQERALFAEQRAANAEQRAQEANASIERIVDAIRTQLPGAAARAAA